MIGCEFGGSIDLKATMNKRLLFPLFLLFTPIVLSAQMPQLAFENGEFIYEGIRYEVLDFHKVVMLDSKEKQILAKMEKVERNKVFIKIGTVLSAGLLSFYPAYEILEEFSFQLHPVAYYIFPVGFLSGIASGIATITHWFINKNRMWNLSVQFVYYFNQNSIPRTRL